MKYVAGSCKRGVEARRLAPVGRGLSRRGQYKAITGGRRTDRDLYSSGSRKDDEKFQSKDCERNFKIENEMEMESMENE